MRTSIEVRWKGNERRKTKSNDLMHCLFSRRSRIFGTLGPHGEVVRLSSVSNRPTAEERNALKNISWLSLPLAEKQLQGTKPTTRLAS